MPWPPYGRTTARSAEGVYAQVLQQLESKHRSIKAMENHEQRKRHEHDSGQAQGGLQGAGRRLAAAAALRAS